MSVMFSFAAKLTEIYHTIIVGIMFIICTTKITMDSCSDVPQSTVLRFSMQSRRNQTGHWITEVQLDHGALNPGGTTGQFWELDVQHSIITPSDGAKVVSITATISSPPSRPAPGYNLFPGLGYYKMHTVGRTWSEALEVCANEGALLAIINSEHEAEILKILFARHPRLANVSLDNQAFIGFHDLYKEGEFLTVFGKPLNSTGFMRWVDSNQPNNSGAGQDLDSDCGGFHKNGGLNDVSCRLKMAFFCEQEI